MISKLQKSIIKLIMDKPNITQEELARLLDVNKRTRMALKSGVDLVLSLPFPYCSATAEKFALSGVTVLDSLNCLDSLGFGSESNDFANILVYANSKSSVAGHRLGEVTSEELKLRNKASFQGMYNQEVISFRRRALLCFFEIIKQKYSHFCLRKRKFLWKEFIRRAKATEEEVSSLSLSR